MTTAAGDHDARNQESLERTRSVAGRLDAGSLGRRLPNGWSVATTLEHIAFWDRFVVQRWKDAIAAKRESPVQIGDQVTDFVNAALEPVLIELDPATAAKRADWSMRDANDVIAKLPRGAVEAVTREDRPRLIDRSLHRNEHLDEIEAALEKSR